MSDEKAGYREPANPRGMGHAHNCECGWCVPADPAAFAQVWGPREGTQSSEPGRGPLPFYDGAAVRLWRWLRRLWRGGSDE